MIDGGGRFCTDDDVDDDGVIRCVDQNGDGGVIVVFPSQRDWRVMEVAVGECVDHGGK